MEDKRVAVLVLKGDMAEGVNSMSMPTYEDIMLPFLQTLADGKMHTLKELHVSLADHFAFHIILSGE